MLRKQLKAIFLLPALLFCFALNAQTIVTGKITDSKGEPLVGASVVVVGTSTGVSADLDGMYRLETSSKPPFKVEFSFIGYNSKVLDVTTGNSKIDVVLDENISTLDEIVVSASRRAEKVQEAPASVSVISAKTMQAASSAVDPIRELINVPGVQIQQQSAARMNIEMRGAAGLFGTGVFPILDYRSLVGAGTGTFQSDASGLNSIDLQRIEVVRGAAGALYGPGVTSGVVHFISKSPIDFPGSTVELMGGEMSTWGISTRVAVASKNKKIGFKINAHNKKGGEFVLDGSEGTTSAGVFTKQISRFRTSVLDPVVSNGVVSANQSAAKVLLSKADLDPDGDGNMMQDFWSNSAINGTLEMRPSSNTKVVLAGGMNANSSVFYNSQGEGLSQSIAYWGQARVQKGGLFAQVFYNFNDGGSPERPTFLYQTGNRTAIERSQLEGQVQYNFNLEKFLNADITVGADYRQAGSNTFNQVYGRNEANDDYNILGAYAQASFELSDRFELVAASRFDRFNFLDDQALSPRLALVYKASKNHTFRASFNQTAAPPDALVMYIDFPVSTPAPGLFDVWLKGMKETAQFSANPVIDLTAPGFPDLPYGTPGLPLAIPYGAVTPSILTGLQAALPATIFPIVRSILTNPANTPTGFSGKFTGYNLFNGLPLAPINTVAPQIRMERTLEFGYKGVINKKLLVTADVYRLSSSGFINFTSISPTIRYSDQNIAADLSSKVGATVRTQLEAALIASGLPAATAAATAAQISAAVAGAYAQGGAAFAAQIAPLSPIFGAVETTGVPQDGMVHSAAGYRTFGSLAYMGIDLGFGYQINNDLSLFANYSGVNQTDFSEEDLGEAKGSGLIFNLGIPKNKFRLGVIYAPETGFRGNIAFQHDDSFYSNAGQFTGFSDPKNLIDIGVGYKLTNGLSIDATCQNLFNQQYRALPNMPVIGRRAVAKITYSF
ncbi:MAG: TonB-dependent receptor [Bacteroidetes bacterium]|nr:TonB-dependent receptor [Bacteroidota bacterium]